MDFENILTLIKAVSDSKLTDFVFKEDGLEIVLKKKQNGRIITTASSTDIIQASANTTRLPLQSDESDSVTIDSTPKGNVVSSPLVGTFYISTTPEDEPFVKIGDRVTKGQTLGIIEAMKLMNEVECEYDGIVEEILIGNEDMVEYGQPLFVIR